MSTDLLDRADVCRLLGNIHPSTLWRGIKAGRFPKPLKVSEQVRPGGTAMTDFGDLSTTLGSRGSRSSASLDLAKLINDEYSVILENERTNLQKALAVGEKLKALRPRIAPDHGNIARSVTSCISI